MSVAAADTRRTAIASPTARPRPRIMAAAIRCASRKHDAADHLPACRAEPERAFLELRGTPRKSSREMLEMIGMIMIVSTTIAVKRSEPWVAVPKSGMKPRTEWSARVDVVEQERRKDDETPEPEDDARDGGERLDKRRHAGRESSRGPAR